MTLAPFTALRAGLLTLVQAPAAQPDPNALARNVFTFGSFFLIFWFFFIRPQSKQRRQQEDMLKAIKKGDEVVTAGGIVGKVVHLPNDQHVVISSENTRLLVERARITRVITAPGAATGAAAGTDG